MNDNTISRRSALRAGGLAAIAAVLPAGPVAAAPELSPSVTTWLVGRPEIAASLERIARTLAVLPAGKTAQLGGLIDGLANILDGVAYPDDDTEA
jgi:hypothetical protein